MQHDPVMKGDKQEKGGEEEEEGNINKMVWQLSKARHCLAASDNFDCLLSAPSFLIGMASEVNF